MTDVSRWLASGHHYLIVEALPQVSDLLVELVLAGIALSPHSAHDGLVLLAHPLYRVRAAHGKYLSVETLYACLRLPQLLPQLRQSK